LESFQITTTVVLATITSKALPGFVLYVKVDP
jgi:hypothetical protein